MEDKTYRVSIVKILDFAFMVEEDLYQPDSSPKFVIGQQSGFNIESEHFNLIIQATYFYNAEQPVAQIDVQNVFHIKGLREFYDSKKDKLTLPQELTLTLLSLSVSHTRALFTKNLRGTRFSNIILPPLDPIAIAKKVFPEEFRNIEADQNKEEVEKIKTATN